MFQGRKQNNSNDRRRHHLSNSRHTFQKGACNDWRKERQRIPGTESKMGKYAQKSEDHAENHWIYCMTFHQFFEHLSLVSSSSSIFNPLNITSPKSTLPDRQCPLPRAGGPGTCRLSGVRAFCSRMFYAPQKKEPHLGYKQLSQCFVCFFLFPLQLLLF